MSSPLPHSPQLEGSASSDIVTVLISLYLEFGANTPFPRVASSASGLYRGPGLARGVVPSHPHAAMHGGGDHGAGCRHRCHFSAP